MATPRKIPKNQKIPKPNQKPKPKLESKSRIKNRLLKLWRDKVRLLNRYRCAVCGDADRILDAHHIEPKELCPALRYDPRNGILLTKSHHKFGKDSFHRSPVWAAEWLKAHRPKQYQYVLDHRQDVVDLDDRETLANIEKALRTPPTPEELEIFEDGCEGCG